MLFFHYPHPIHYPDPHGTGYRQTRVVVQLFPNYYDYPHQSILNRWKNSICQSGKIERIVADLHIGLRPYWNRLDKLRGSLLEAYSNYAVRLAGLGAEKHIGKSSGEVLDGIYSDFRLTFQTITKELEGKDIPLVCLQKIFGPS